MLKRLAIVISACIGIVFVPYFIGRLIPFDYLGLGVYWLDGFISILFVALGLIIYCVLDLVYKYIKNGE